MNKYNTNYSEVVVGDEVIYCVLYDERFIPEAL